MGTALENMCRGEIMQAQAFLEDKLNTEYYVEQVSLKTASLLADACRCTVLLRGDDTDSTLATAAWEYGFHVGIAYQVSKDVDQYTKLVTATHADAGATADRLNELVALPPFFCVASRCPQLAALAHDGFKAE